MAKDHNIMQKKYQASFLVDTDKTAVIDTQNTKAVILISIGQSYHEDAKFLATINLLNKSGFSKCDIMIADTLQRYNYYNIMSATDSYEHSYLQGNMWIERNINTINKLIPRHEIIRWNENINHPLYNNHKNAIINLFENDSGFRSSIDLTINNFLKRKFTGDTCNLIELRKNCFDYIMEETPVLTPLWHTLGYDFVIYPQKMTPITRYTYTKILPLNESKLSWLYLKFR